MLSTGLDQQDKKEAVTHIVLRSEFLPCATLFFSLATIILLRAPRQKLIGIKLKYSLCFSVRSREMSGKKKGN